MNIIYNKIFLEHETGSHPENKRRLMSLGKLPDSPIESGEVFLDLVHKTDYIAQIQEACACGGGYLDLDTIVSQQSYEAAIRAAGAVVAASQSNDFALVRPPGHHAYPARASGFCLFNNIAIATQKLVNEGKRVLIFDFDGHCGDGTETFFYKSDKVLFWSLHQYPAFPGIGSEDEIGEGEGKGFTVNVPLPPGSGDDLFWKAMEALLPIAKQFTPDAVAVSAGFDAHHADPLLDLRLSAMTYYRLGEILSGEFANVFATLEGGYNLDYLPRCIKNFVTGISHEKIHFEESPTVSSGRTADEFGRRMNRLTGHLSKFWNI